MKVYFLVTLDVIRGMLGTLLCVKSGTHNEVGSYSLPSMPFSLFAKHRNGKIVYHFLDLKASARCDRYCLCSHFMHQSKSCVHH